MATQALAVNGAKVYITGRTGEKLDRVAELYSKNIPGQIIPIPADVTSKESIQKLVDQISAKESKLHILINNAGIGSKDHNTEQSDPQALQEELFNNKSTFQEWEEVIQTNVLHLFFTTTAFIPLLNKGSEDEYGWSSTVVNIGLRPCQVCSASLFLQYQQGCGRSFDEDAGPRGRFVGREDPREQYRARVFPSEMTTGGCDEKQKSSIPKARFEGKFPARRPGKEEDMAGAVLFTTANQYVNGQTIVVDGGYLLSAGSA